MVPLLLRRWCLRSLLAFWEKDTDIEREAPKEETILSFYREEGEKGGQGEEREEEREERGNSKRCIDNNLHLVIGFLMYLEPKHQNLLPYFS